MLGSGVVEIRNARDRESFLVPLGQIIKRGSGYNPGKMLKTLCEILCILKMFGSYLSQKYFNIGRLYVYVLKLLCKPSCSWFRIHSIPSDRSSTSPPIPQ